MIKKSKAARTEYACRFSSCDQFCRDANHYKLDSEKIVQGLGGHEDYICSCSRDFLIDQSDSTICHPKPKCFSNQMLCDYDFSKPTETDDFKCIGINQICDGVNQCTDGSDEAWANCIHKNSYTCSADMVACPTERKCLNSTSVCDGTLDCQVKSDYNNLEMVLLRQKYHSDEDRGFCKSNFECPTGSKRCANDWQCLIDSKWGDGKLDCIDSGNYFFILTQIFVWGRRIH